MPRPSSITHDDVVSRLLAVGAALDAKEVAASFLAGLTSAPARFRSPLANAGYAVNLPPHAFVPSGPTQDHCAVCGLYPTLTLRDDGNPWQEPHVALLDLEDYVAGPKPSPTAADVACFDRMLEVLAAVPAEGRAADLIKGWSKVVPRTNARDRRELLSALGAAGVLETLDHPGRLTRWVGFWEDQEMPSLSGELRPPEGWWRGSDGAHRAALDDLFPRAGIGRDRFAARGIRDIVVGPSTIPKGGKARGLALDPGDLLGFRIRNSFFVATVLGCHRIRAHTLPVLEILDATWSEWPDPKRLDGMGVRQAGPFRRGPQRCREPLVLDGMGTFPGMTTVVLARGANLRVSADAPLPDYGYRVVASRNLLYLTGSIAAMAPRIE